MKKLVLAGLVLLASVMVLAGCMIDYFQELLHEHKFAKEWNYDGIHHWKDAACEHTEVSGEKAEHTFVYLNVWEDGVYRNKKVCNVCKYSPFVWVQGDSIVGAKYTDNYEGVFIEGRTVTLSDFYMGKYEVTQYEYASVMAGQKITVDGVDYELESNPSYCTEGSTSYTLFEGDEQGKRPVEGVTWYDAVWYCNALSARDELTPAYNIVVTKVEQVNGKGYSISDAEVTVNEGATGYRLPTEAEWEYAARGGAPAVVDWNYTFSGADKAAGTQYSDSKNRGLDTVGWYWYNTVTGTTGDTNFTSGKQGYGTHQVGKKAANRLGIYDMSGNVFEWCYDWYSSTINTGKETDPQGATSGSKRVRRGGTWSNTAGSCVVSYRHYDYASNRSFLLGFRVVCPSSK